MVNTPSYSMEEARDILLDSTITLESHIYLEGRREEYVRAEDYDRPGIVHSCFRHIWSSAHADWDWDKEKPPTESEAEYYAQRNAVYHWFRANTRIRGGFKGLSHDVEKTKWSAEDVCGNIYKKAILEWVEAKSGFIPGHADGFLAQYREARGRLFRSLSADEVRACQRTADEWNGSAVPHHIQVQNFNNKFASTCRAFTNMLLKDYGVFPFVFYIGVPGHDVPAGVYEAMRKEGLAAQTFRSFTKLDNVFRDMKSYVNMNVDVLYRADAKRPPPVRSAEHLKAAEYEFRREDVVDQRVNLYEDRLKEGWEDNSAHLFYQLVQFCHSVITNSKQTPPPWKALSQDPSKLIVGECLPISSVLFGSSPEKTLREHRNTFIKHWFQIGYLQFHHHYGRNGTFAAPSLDRWHALPKYEQAFTEQWLSNERTARGKGPSTPAAPSSTTTSVKFGSSGPRMSFDNRSPYHDWKTQEPGEAIERDIPDPDDQLVQERPPHRPGLPSWPAPCIVPDTIYARVQWSSQLLNETGGRAAATLLESVNWLAQLPPVANYDYDIRFFRRQDGKDRAWAIDSLPEWLTWGLGRSHLEDQNEVDSLAAFLETKAWSFQHDGKRRFAGVQMAWTVALAGIIYLRAMRQTEEASASPPSRWSLSGGPEWQQRAQNYSFTLDYETLRTIAHEFRCYIEDLTLSLPVAGLPPSLLYFHHLSREQYVYTLASSVPELRELFLLVLKMPSDGETTYPSLPVFAGKRIWQLPQLGIPRMSHKEHASGPSLVESLRDTHRFVGENGHRKGAEAGLSALLELCLVWADLDRLSDPDDLPAYLRCSTIAQDPGVDVLKEALLACASAHAGALRESDGKPSRRRSGANRKQSDEAAQFLLNAGEVDVDAELLAHQKATNNDSLQSRIRDSVQQEKTREARWKSNEALRRDQNALNLATYHSIHPAKSSPSPLAIPNFDSLHEPVTYTPAEAPHSPSAAGANTRRKHSALGSPLREPIDATTGRSLAALVPAMAKTAEGSWAEPGGTARASAAPKRRGNEDLDMPRSKRLHCAPKADVRDGSLEPSPIEVDHDSGSDSDSDACLPMTISHKPLTTRVAAHSYTETQEFTSFPLHAGAQSPVPPAKTAGSAVAGSVLEEPGTIEGSSLVTRILPPRPRRTDPNRRGIPGISTGFGYIRGADHVS